MNGKVKKFGDGGLICQVDTSEHFQELCQAHHNVPLLKKIRHEGQKLPSEENPFESVQSARNQTNSSPLLVTSQDTSERLKMLGVGGLSMLEFVSVHRTRWRSESVDNSLNGIEHYRAKDPTVCPVGRHNVHREF